MKTYVIANQKGGVGKTAIACHLSFHLFERGHKVLHIDLDPQGNSSKTLSAYQTGIKASQLFATNKLSIEAREPDGGAELALIAADPVLSDIERADGKVLGVFNAQLKALDSRFDYCVIDTAPTLGVRMTAALIAGQFVVSPIELEGYSLDGIKHMLQTFRGIREKYNPALKFLGMLPNRYNAVSPAQRANLNELMTHQSGFMVNASIPTRSAISEALNAGIPVWRLNKTSAREAGKEVRAALDAILSKSE